VVGAVQYLQRRSDLHSKRFGALGISLGAGIVLLAAARIPVLVATVADSSWTDESAQVDRMDTISYPPFLLPLLPYASLGRYPDTGSSSRYSPSGGYQPNCSSSCSTHSLCRRSEHHYSACR
jgi:hypothetical protein